MSIFFPAANAKAEVKMFRAKNEFKDRIRSLAEQGESELILPVFSECIFGVDAEAMADELLDDGYKVTVSKSRIIVNWS